MGDFGKSKDWDPDVDEKLLEARADRDDLVRLAGELILSMRTNALPVRLETLEAWQALRAKVEEIKKGGERG